MLINEIQVDEFKTIKIDDSVCPIGDCVHITFIEKNLLNYEEYVNYADGDGNHQVLPIYEENNILLSVGYEELQELIDVLKRKSAELKPLYLKSKAERAKKIAKIRAEFKKD